MKNYEMGIADFKERTISQFNDFLDHILGNPGDITCIEIRNLKIVGFMHKSERFDLVYIVGSTKDRSHTVSFYFQKDPEGCLYDNLIHSEYHQDGLSEYFKINKEINALKMQQFVEEIRLLIKQFDFEKQIEKLSAMISYGLCKLPEGCSLGTLSGGLPSLGKHGR